MAGIGALLVQPRQPRQYMVRTSIANMRENEVIERYRLSPERIQWLVALLEDKLERDTGRNFPLSAETQVSVVKLVHNICNIQYGELTFSEYENKISFYILY